jgi:integrase
MPSATGRSVRLTTSSLNRLVATDRRYNVFDAALPAFGVRVEPSGRKTFQLWYRVEGRLRAATIGRYGVLTLDEARKKAREILVEAGNGSDPLSRRDASKAALTVREASGRWLVEQVQPRRKAATVRLYKLALDGHILPKLGARPITTLSTEDVAALHRRLKATPTLANRCVAVLSSFCTWCEREGMRPPHSHPCTGKLIERYRESSRKRYLTGAEYGRLGTALRKAEREQSINPLAARAIHLLLLTGCRPAEITALRWSEVDLKAKVLRLADSKTGAKTVQLPSQAVTLLRRAPRFAGSEYVFPGTGRKVLGAHLVNLAKPWAVLKKAAALDDVRLYDAVRHSFASVAVSRHGHALSVVGELLGHSQAATTKRYSHLHDDAAKAAANEIASTISSALKGKGKSS